MASEKWSIDKIFIDNYIRSKLFTDELKKLIEKKILLLKDV